MDRKEFIKKADEKLKIIRLEKDFTQDKMAEILGISKKTLIQVEKGRSSLGWSGAVILFTIFKDSEVVQITFGGQAQEVILMLAFNSYGQQYERTMGGKIWWKDLDMEGSYKIQQNMISQHFRILDEQYRRISSSFDYDWIRKRLTELSLEK